eukprot:s568_g13.t1
MAEEAPSEMPAQEQTAPAPTEAPPATKGKVKGPGKGPPAKGKGKAAWLQEAFIIRRATAEESTRQKARSSLIQAAKDGSLEKSLQDFKEKAAMPEATASETTEAKEIPPPVAETAVAEAASAPEAAAPAREEATAEAFIITGIQYLHADCHCRGLYHHRDPAPAAAKGKAKGPAKGPGKGPPAPAAAKGKAKGPAKGPGKGPPAKGKGTGGAAAAENEQKEASTTDAVEAKEVPSAEPAPAEAASAPEAAAPAKEEATAEAPAAAKGKAKGPAKGPGKGPPAKGKATGGAAAPEDEQKEASPNVALDPLAPAAAEEPSTKQKAAASLLQAAKDGSLEKSLQDFEQKAAAPEAKL